MSVNIQDINKAFNTAKSKHKPISNFYSEVWGNMSENDHTRILLAVLKTEVNGNLPFLEDFCETFRIEVDLTAVKREEIYFNKHYHSDSNSFVDGLILPSNKNFAIIIENKVCGACDQEDQIDRYINCCKEEKVSIDNIWTVYITADGTLHNGVPTETSLKDYAVEIADRLLCLNYKQDILPWLRRIKYNLKASMYSCIDSYIDYLELIFQEDIVSKQADNDIKKALGITNLPLQDKYRRLKSILKEIDQIQNPEFADLKNNVFQHITEIEQPYWEKFNEITRKYFENKDIEISRLKFNNNKGEGFIQIRSTKWDYHIHYEWVPISFEKLFFEKNSLCLQIHIEGKGVFVKARTGLNIPTNYQIDRNECGLNMIQNNSFERWLSDAYNNVIDSWNTLETINEKLKNGGYNNL